MKLRKAMARADELRPNAISEEHKAEWVHQLEGRIAETLEAEPPENSWPEDRELLMPHPWDNVYELWLCCMIDFANTDLQRYQMDAAVYEAAYEQAVAWWRRNHRPTRESKGVVL